MSSTYDTRQRFVEPCTALGVGYLCKLGVWVDRGGLGLHAYTLHGNIQAMLDGAFNDVPGQWQPRRQREVDVGATQAEVVDGVSGKPTASISEGGVSQ